MRPKYPSSDRPICSIALSKAIMPYRFREAPMRPEKVHCSPRSDNEPEDRKLSSEEALLPFVWASLSGLQSLQCPRICLLTAEEAARSLERLVEFQAEVERTERRFAALLRLLEASLSSSFASLPTTSQ